MRSGRGAHNSAAGALHAASRRRVLTHPDHEVSSACGSGIHDTGSRGVFQPGRTCDPTAARPDKPFNNRCADARCPDPNAHGYDEANAHGRR